MWCSFITVVFVTHHATSSVTCHLFLFATQSQLVWVTLTTSVGHTEIRWWVESVARVFVFVFYFFSFSSFLGVGDSMAWIESWFCGLFETWPIRDYYNTTTTTLNPEPHHLLCQPILQQQNKAQPYHSALLFVRKEGALALFPECMNMQSSGGQSWHEVIGQWAPPPPLSPSLGIPPRLAKL